MKTETKRTELKIDKDIPPPAPRIAPRQLFEKLEIGHSIVVPKLKHGHGVAYVLKPLQAKGWKFVQRREEGGVRIWRTK